MKSQPGQTRRGGSPSFRDLDSSPMPHFGQKR